MRYCKNCKSEIKEGQRFCSKCGAKAEAVTEKILAHTTVEPEETYVATKSKSIFFIIGGVIVVIALAIGFVFFLFRDSNSKKAEVEKGEKATTSDLFEESESEREDSLLTGVVSIETIEGYNNISNGGLVAGDGQNIYYNDLISGAIIKGTSAMNEELSLCQADARNICYSDGDIYYTDRRDGGRN